MRTVHLNDYISFGVNTNVAIHVDPMITANITVYTYVNKKKDGSFTTDVMDCEVDWKLNGDCVKYDGFKELYIKLYGKDKFDKLLKDVCEEAEKFVEGRVATSFPDIIRDEL